LYDSSFNQATVALWQSLAFVSRESGSGPIPRKNRPVYGPGVVEFICGSYRWCGAEVLERRCRLKCRPRLLTTVQIYEVRFKIVPCSFITGR
ncbi:hypothetical protein AVEN_266101-1, partial [Araneus ventricosus]